MGDNLIQYDRKIAEFPIDAPFQIPDMQFIIQRAQDQLGLDVFIPAFHPLKETFVSGHFFQSLLPLADSGIRLFETMFFILFVNIPDGDPVHGCDLLALRMLYDQEILEQRIPALSAIKFIAVPDPFKLPFILRGVPFGIISDLFSLKRGFRINPLFHLLYELFVRPFRFHMFSPFTGIRRHCNSFRSL